MIAAIAAVTVTGGLVWAALSGGDRKTVETEKMPPPEGRYRPQAETFNAKNLAAARGVWRAE